jgi:hypothetical protein
LEYGLNNTYKELSLYWYNKTEDNKFLGFNDGIFDSYAKYKKGTISAVNRQENNDKYSYTIENAGYVTFESEEAYSEGDYVYY